MADDQLIDGFAEMVLAILRWNWMDRDFSSEARRVLPRLFLELYLAEKTGQRINKKEACQMMGVDHARTGPKYIAQAEGKDLVAIVRRPAEDRRKDFLEATPRLKATIGEELAWLADRVQYAGRAAAHDEGVPSSGDTPSKGSPTVAELLEAAKQKRRAGNYRGAIDGYRKALEIEPNLEEAWAGIDATKRAFNDEWGHVD